MSREIYCCGCKKKVQARLTDGQEIYTHRPDLYQLPFWICDSCGNFVGCHHKTENRTRPLGCIPTPELKEERKKIHSILDPLWKEGHVKRSDIYRKLSKDLGWKYHTAKIRSLEEAENVLSLLQTYTANMD